MKSRSSELPKVARRLKLAIVHKALGQVREHEKNPRVHPAKGTPEYDRLRESLRFDYFDPLVWNRRNNKLVSGHLRRKILIDLGVQSADMVVVDYDERTHLARLLAANELVGVNADAKVAAILKLVAGGQIPAGLTAMTDERIAALIALAEAEKGNGLNHLTLAEKFGVPPFSVLDARQGYWQDRKAAWLSLGIRSEIGRGDNLLKFSDTVKQPDSKKRRLAKTFGTEGNVAGDWTGTSIFDPVLCELAYRWFCPKHGQVLDPFAGGSVRGVVAGWLGHSYLGIDLRKRQIRANQLQWKMIRKKFDFKNEVIGHPVWETGNSLDLDSFAKRKFDFFFSCPPYFDLEKYSRDPNDLSNAKSYDDFLTDLNRIVARCSEKLLVNRFAAFVVGDIRDPEGNYRNFVSQTIRAFELAGLKLYNEAILVTSVGSLPIRISKQFEGSRKLGKTHQNLLVFIKGDARKATAEIGKVDFGEIKSLDAAPGTTEGEK